MKRESKQSALLVGTRFEAVVRRDFTAPFFRPSTRQSKEREKGRLLSGKLGHSFPAIRKEYDRGSQAISFLS